MAPTPTPSNKCPLNACSLELSLSSLGSLSGTLLNAALKEGAQERTQERV